jgi:YVTN family beta-propeller protein
VAVHSEGTRVYVSNTDSDEVSVIDTGTNTVIETVPVGGTQWNDRPYGIAVNPEGTRAYVALVKRDTVWVIDTATDTVINTVEVGDGPISCGDFFGPAAPFDSDEDGLPDVWETAYFGDLDQGPDGDYDGDGLTNLEEYETGTDPTKTDTDSDGLSDAWEIQNGTNPTNSDTDSDGMPDGWEVQHGLDPLNWTPWIRPM